MSKKKWDRKKEEEQERLSLSFSSSSIICVPSRWEITTKCPFFMSIKARERERERKRAEKEKETDVAIDKK